MAAPKPESPAASKPAAPPKPASEPALLTSIKAVEDLWVGVLERAVRTPGLLRLGLGWLDLRLSLRNLLRRRLQKITAAWGLPQPEQQREVLAMLARIEGRLLDLEQQLAPAAGAVAVAPAPAPAPAPAAPPEAGDAGEVEP